MRLKSRGCAACRGFTLIEVLMVIVILGVLAAIAIMVYTDMARTAREGAARGNLGAIRSAVHSFYAQQATTGQPRWPSNAELAAIFPDGQIPRNPIIFASTNHDARSRDINRFNISANSGPVYTLGTTLWHWTATHYGWFIYDDTGNVHAYTDGTNSDPRSW